MKVYVDKLNLLLNNTYTFLKYFRFSTSLNVRCDALLPFKIFWQSSLQNFDTVSLSLTEVLTQWQLMNFIFVCTAHPLNLPLWFHAFETARLCFNLKKKSSMSKLFLICITKILETVLKESCLLIGWYISPLFKSFMVLTLIRMHII